MIDALALPLGFSQEKLTVLYNWITSIKRNKYVTSSVNEFVSLFPLISSIWVITIFAASDDLTSHKSNDGISMVIKKTFHWIADMMRE